MFLSEKELKDKFWKYYNYKGRAKRYQFECSLREGDIDLVTIEVFQENWQVNGFEFKLTDIKKAIKQAEVNSSLVHRSWIVVPIDRKGVIENKYIEVIRSKHLGLIYVEDGGRWTIAVVPHFNNAIPFSQLLLNIAMENV